MTMKYYRVPVNNGEFDIDYLYLVEGVGVSDTEAYVKLREGFDIRESWQEITELEWQAFKDSLLIAEPVTPPSVTTLMGQYIVQQTLKNAELEQKIDAAGVGIVQLMLKGSEV